MSIPEVDDTISRSEPLEPRRRFFRRRYIDEYPTGWRRVWVIGLIVLAWTVENFELYKAGPVLPYIFEEFDTNLTTWGYLAAGAGVATMIGGLTLSRLSDRFGRRPVIIWPVLIYGIVMVIGALAPNLAVFSLTIFAGALLVSGMGPTVNAALRDVTPQTGRATSYGFLGTAYTLGALISTWVAAETIPIWPGFRAQYWIGAAVAGAIFVILFIFYRDLSPRIRNTIIRDREAGMRAAAEKAGYASVADAMKAGDAVFRNWRLWVLAGYGIFWGIAYVTVGNYVPLYIVSFHGISPASASGLASMFWLTFTVALVFSGWLCDRLQVRKVIGCAGGISTGIMFFVIAFLPQTQNITELSLIWAATGVCAGFIYPAQVAMLSENAEAVSPFGVARAFSIQSVAALVSAVVLNLGLPQVVGDGSGWPMWMVAAGVSCCLITVCLAVGGVGPWIPPAWRRDRSVRSIGT